LICKLPSINSNIQRPNYNNRSNNSHINDPNTYKKTPETNTEYTKDKLLVTSKKQDGYNQSSNNLGEDDDTLFQGKCIIDNFGECVVEFKLSSNQYMIFY